MIRFSPRAVDELRDLRDTRRFGAGDTVYLAAPPGGCLGRSYALDLRAAPPAGAAEFPLAGGLRLAVPRDQLGLLAGLAVDFVDDGLNYGFVFANPAARQTCGCGSSFLPRAEGAA